jgi:hypothetical protein
MYLLDIIEIKDGTEGRFSGQRMDDFLMKRSSGLNEMMGMTSWTAGKFRRGYCFPVIGLRHEGF